ncbi:MAG: FliH/SctL family protein [Planctomycetota bacterium]
MPVIKNDNTKGGRVMGKLAALNIANFTDQAQRVLLKAGEEADALLADARRQAEQLREEARAAGYAEGHAQGLADGQADGAEQAFAKAMETFDQQTASLRDVLREMIDQLGAARETLLVDARAELLDLACRIAEKVTHVRAGDIEAARGNLAAALEMANCASTIQAKVCPQQLDQLREYAAEFVEGMGLSAVLTLVADPRLTPGDVVLQTPQGEVDARIRTQLDDLVRVLTGRADDDADEEAVA